MGKSDLIFIYFVEGTNVVIFRVGLQKYAIAVLIYGGGISWWLKIESGKVAGSKLSLLCP